MQRAAHGSSFDECTVFPERALNGPPIEMIDPSPQGQLGRGHHLSVQAAEAAGDCQEAASRRALIEVLAANAPRCRSCPGKLQHSLTIMPA